MPTRALDAGVPTAWVTGDEVYGADSKLRIALQERAIGYVLPRWEGLTRYCEDGALAIDNNLSERMVRPIAIGRKNYLFVGSDNGGKAAAILYSVLASAKSNQVEPFGSTTT